MLAPAMVDAFVGCARSPAPRMAQPAPCFSTTTRFTAPCCGASRPRSFKDALTVAFLLSTRVAEFRRLRNLQHSFCRGCELVNRRPFDQIQIHSLGYAQKSGSLARCRVRASSADLGNYSDGNKTSHSPAESIEAIDLDKRGTSNVECSNDKKKRLQAAGVIAILVVVGSIAAIVATLTNGGPAALVAAIAKSGFSAAFALIFVSEIGDKTFFIAALLAMRHSRGLVLLGASGALALMTVISVVIGRLCQRVPNQLQTTLPIGEYAAVALLIWFGFRSLKNAYDLPSEPAKSEGSQAAECGELAVAEEFLKKAEGEKKVSTPLEVLVEAFSLVFVAEWGDRSMLATVALGAAQSPWGVASGAIAGHVLATAIAVIGGAFLAEHISEKVIGYVGGFLFLAFAAATLMGVF